MLREFNLESLQEKRIRIGKVIFNLTRAGLDIHKFILQSSHRSLKASPHGDSEMSAARIQ